MKKYLKILFSVIISTQMTIFGFTANAGNNQILDSGLFPDYTFFTLLPGITPVGPIYKGDQTDYIRQIFPILLGTASGIAKDLYINGAQNPEYYTYLVTALLVPFHESHLMHFRESNGNACEDSANKLGYLANIATGAKRSWVSRNDARHAMNVYNSQFRSPEHPLFPDCRHFDKSQTTTQVMASSAFVDGGIMQLNINAHPTAYAPQTYFNIYQSVDYGLNFLFDGKTGASGFVAMLEKYKDGRYACLRASAKNDHGKFTSVRNYANLPRSAWAGGYNSASMSNACRYLRKGPWSKNDIAYYENYKKLIFTNKSIYHDSLPVGSLERSALDELINNYRLIIHAKPTSNNTIRHYYLDTLLSSFDRNMMKKKYVEIPASSKESVNQNVAVENMIIGSRLTFRTAPSVGATECGQIRSSGALPKVMVLNPDAYATDEKGREWALIQFPRYASYAFFTNNKDQFCNSAQSFYVIRSQLREVGDREFSKTGIITTNNTNVRPGYSMSSGRSIATLKLGTEVQIVKKYTYPNPDKVDVWYQIVIPGTGSLGWIYHTLVKINET